MLRVMARPRVAAISSVKTTVSGTTRKTRRCTRLMFEHDLRLLFAGLVGNLLDERRGQRFERPYLVRQAQVHSPPVAGGGQCGDALELRWQRALNDVKSRQDGRISLEVERAGD